jgi:hypothetical protein
MSDFPPLAHPTDEYLDFAPVDTLPVTTLPVDTPSVFAELVCADPELLRAEFERPGRRRSCHRSRGRGQDPVTGRAGPAPAVLPGDAARPDPAQPGTAPTDTSKTPARER